MSLYDQDNYRPRHEPLASCAWQRGKGRESGLPMSMEWAQVISVRDGKITRVDAYDNRQEALEAAGLSE